MMKLSYLRIFIILIIGCFPQELQAQNESPFSLNGLATMVLSNDTIIPVTRYGELGNKYVRLGISWRSIHPDSANWTPIDNWADFYGNYGVEPIIIFNCLQEIPDTSATADTTGWSYCEQQNWLAIHDTSSTIIDSGTAYYPQDTSLWIDFLTAFVDRYNGDGVNDYANLTQPFRIYQFETEMPRSWCKDNPNWEVDFVEYVNLSYDVIKSVDTNTIVKYGGHATYDPYLIYADSSLYDIDSVQISLTNSVSKADYVSALSGNSGFLSGYGKFDYIMNNAQTDAYDVHCYGLAEWLPFRANAIKTIYGDKEVWSLEGGGPYRGDNAFEVFTPDTNNGWVSPELMQENASFLIRYYVGGVGGGFSKLGWQVLGVYDNWGQKFGDMGLMTISANKKPSYWTYAGLSDLIENYTSISPVPNGLFWSDPDLIAYECITPDKNLLFLWNLNDSSQISLDGIEMQHIYPNVFGQTSWSQLIHDPLLSYSFTIDRNPIILEMTDPVLSTNQSIESPDLSSFDVRLFPNPNIGNFSIQTNRAETFQLRLFDATGRLIYQTIFSGSQTQIDVSNAHNGVYIYHLSSLNGEHIKTGKVVIN